MEKVEEAKESEVADNKDGADEDDASKMDENVFK